MTILWTMKLKTEFSFCGAHRLVGYDGACNFLHGHTWKVELEIDGDETEIDEVGIIWDFKNANLLKDIFDHKTILKLCKENQDLVYAITKSCGSDSLFIMEENPTAEYLSKKILQIIKEQLRKDSKLKFKIRVWENDRSWAEVEG